MLKDRASKWGMVGHGSLRNVESPGVKSLSSMLNSTGLGDKEGSQ